MRPEEQIDLFKNYLRAVDSHIFPGNSIPIKDITDESVINSIEKDALACYIPEGYQYRHCRSYGVIGRNWNHRTLKDVGLQHYCSAKKQVGYFNIGISAAALRIAVHEVRHRVQNQFTGRIELFGNHAIKSLSLAIAFRQALVYISDYRGNINNFEIELDAYVVEFLLIRKLKLKESEKMSLSDIVLMQPSGLPIKVVS